MNVVKARTGGHSFGNVVNRGFELFASTLNSLACLDLTEGLMRQCSMLHGLPFNIILTHRSTDLR
jgi:hypothetical protein